MAGRSEISWALDSSPLLFCVLAALLASAGACRRDADVALFDGPREIYGLKALPRLELSLTPASRAALTRAPRAWADAELRYGAMRWDVGLRLKGHRSFRGLGDKPSFKVKLTHKDKRARFLGLKGLVLNNLVEDPSLVREVFAYRLHRAMGVPAPNAGFAEVWLDGEPYGLYLFLEPIDDEFLEARFDGGAADGELYEGEYGCDLDPADVPGFQRKEGGEDRAPLAALAAAAAGPVDGLVGGDAARFDPSALAYLAVSAVIGDFDGYRHGHNYHLYRQPVADRWFFVPWGLDRTFKQHLSVYDSAGLVARRCFADRACRIAYLRQLGRAADELERLRFDQGLKVLAAFTDRALAADPKKPYDDGETRKARSALLEFVRTRPGEIRAALACLGQGGGEVDRDGDGFGCLDCDDGDPAIHPGAAEVCGDGEDDDCNQLVDDDATCACPEITVEGARFALCDLQVGWDDARARCAARGGTLARLDSATQASAVYAAAKAIEDDAWWIGLDDRAEEGRFGWTDGAAVGFTHWASGQPDNDACNQDCVALRKDGRGRWADAACGQPSPFVCRLP
jgi:hypothetical protein